MTNVLGPDLLPRTFRALKPIWWAIRQVNGGGSPDTIMALLEEIKEETLASKYPAEATFRGLYTSIFAKGRAERQPEIDELSRELDVARIERDAARLKESEIQIQLKNVVGWQTELQEKLRLSLEDSVAGGKKIVALQQEHAREVRVLRLKLEKAVRKAASTARPTPKRQHMEKP